MSKYDCKQGKIRFKIVTILRVKFYQELAWEGEDFISRSSYMLDRE